MDPYDAILDQIKKAQSQGVEAVKDRLDRVLASLEQAVREAKSSVEDAMPSSPDEVFGLAGLTATVTELKGRMSEAPSGAVVVSLDVLRNLDRARSQSDLLHELLALLAEHAGRAVVLVIRNDSVNAWSGIGFEDGSRLKAWNGEVTASNVFARFIEEVRPVRFAPGHDPLLGSWLEGLPQPEEAIMVPVVLRGKLMGGIYVDRLPQRPWNPQAVQQLMAIGCWMIDTLRYRTEAPAPMVAEIIEVAAGEPVIAPEAVAEAVPETEEEAFVEYELEDEPEVPESAVASGDEEITAEREFDPSATVQVDVSEVPDTPAPTFEPELTDEAAIVPPEESAPPSVEPVVAVEPIRSVEPVVAPVEPVMEVDAVPEKAIEYEPPPEVPPPAVAPSVAAGADEGFPSVEPPPVEPVVPPSQPEEPATSRTAEDEARHEEARRFARLLVSEIKLYNEEEVDRGRAGRDLYQRLKEDIDRSREMYEKRIPPEIRAARDYFHEELVRILGDGNPDALGM